MDTTTENMATARSGVIKEFNTRVKHKIDTEANWTSENPILLSGELGIVVLSDDVKVKVGDGITHFNDLDYAYKTAASEGQFLPLSGGNLSGDINRVKTTNVVTFTRSPSVNLVIDKAIWDNLWQGSSISPQPMTLNGATEMWYTYAPSSKVSDVTWVSPSGDMIYVRYDATTDSCVPRQTRSWYLNHVTAGSVSFSMDTISDTTSEPYIYGVASSDRLGGIKVGQNLAIDENGVLSAAAAASGGTSEIIDIDGGITQELKDKVTRCPSSLLKYQSYVYTPTFIGYQIPDFYMSLAADEVPPALYYLVINWDRMEFDAADMSTIPVLDEDGKIPSEYLDVSGPSALSDLTSDATHRTVTDDEKAVWNAKADASALSNYLPLSGGTISGPITIGLRKSGQSVGLNSIAHGVGVAAVGGYSHAHGNDTTASGSYSFANGYSVSATGEYSHAEGYMTSCTARASHSEGYRTTADGNYAHAEGNMTIATGEHSHAEGYRCQALDDHAHAEGYNTKAEAPNSHTEGYGTRTNNQFAHAEGYEAKAFGRASHADGWRAVANEDYSYAWSGDRTLQQYMSHGEGTYNINPRNGISGLYIGEQNLGQIMDASMRWESAVVDPSTQVLKDKCVNIVALNNFSSDLHLSIPTTPSSSSSGLCEFSLILVSSGVSRTVHLDNLSSWYGTKLSTLDTANSSYYIRFQQISPATPTGLASNYVVMATPLELVTAQ